MTCIQARKLKNISKYWNEWENKNFSSHLGIPHHHHYIVLLTFNFTLFRLTDWLILSDIMYIRSRSSSIFSMYVSSANEFTITFKNCDGNSFMHRANNIAPITEPCGTPKRTDAHFHISWTWSKCWFDLCNLI